MFETRKATDESPPVFASYSYTTPLVLSESSKWSIEVPLLELTHYKMLDVIASIFYSPASLSDAVSTLFLFVFFPMFILTTSSLLQKCHVALFELSRKRLDFLDFCVVSPVPSEAELAKHTQTIGNAILSPVHIALHQAYKREVS